MASLAKYNNNTTSNSQRDSVEMRRKNTTKIAGYRSPGRTLRYSLVEFTRRVVEFDRARGSLASDLMIET